ncbi:MAG TPA: NTP transferase domain-containing protein, partial [Bacillota bacterium]|nr:NTP transferase domain-containing protein [Bacillota bacterium]
MEETKKAIVLAAGSGTRWGNYLGVPKQMIEIDGERLLLRTIRQLRARGFEVLVTVPKIGYFGDIPAKEIVGVDDIEIDKFINAKDHVGAIFFWGDTYFTDEAMD